MRRILAFRGWAVAVLALSFGNAVVFGQPHESTPGVPVRVWGSAFGGANPSPAQVEVSSADTFLPDGAGNGPNFPFVGTRSAGGNAWFDTQAGTIHMEPGKAYSIHVDALNAGSVVNSVGLNLAAPMGYQVEIDYQVRQRAEAAGTSRFFIVRLLGSRERSYMPAGQATQLSTGRVYWQVGLGGLRNGKAAGALAIVDNGGAADWSVLYTIAALHYESPSPEILVVPKAGGLIRQIIANQAAVDIVTSSEDASLTATQYELRFYHPGLHSTHPEYTSGAELGQIATGSGIAARTFVGQPYLTYRIEQDGIAEKLKITSHARNTSSGNGWTASIARTATTSLGRTGTSWPNFTWTRLDWNDPGQPQKSKQVTASSGTVASRNDVVTVEPGSGGTAASYHQRTYQVYSWGEEIKTSTLGSANGLVTEYDYYNNTAEVGRHGFLKWTKLPGGGWESYDYWDATSATGTKRIGTLRFRYRPFEDGPTDVSFNAGLGEFTQYDFADDPFGVSTRPTLVETKVANVVTARSQTTYQDETGPVAGTVVVRAQRQDSSESGKVLTTVTKFFKENTQDLFYRNLVHSVVNPDGTKTSYAYSRGSYNLTTKAFVASPTGKASRVVAISGTSGTGYSAYDGYAIDPLTLVAGKSTLSVVIRDARALVRRNESHVWVGGAWQLIAWTDFSYDTMGNLVERKSSNESLYEAQYVGDQKQFEVDESGVRVDFEYDAAGRIWRTKKRNDDNTGFSTILTLGYDAAGRRTSETVSASGSSETVVTVREFDNAGRIVGETLPGTTPASGYSHAYVHSYNTTLRTHTVSKPASTGQLVQTYYRDGRLKSITGNGVVAEHYDYNVEANGRRYRVVNYGSSNSPRFLKEWADWLGRPVKSEFPGFSAVTPSSIVVEHFYDDSTTGLGRRFKTTRSGYSPVFYSYDVLGRPTRVGVDMSAPSNGLQLASNDRIIDSDEYVELYDGTYWLRSDSKSYATGGSSTAFTASIIRQRLTGFSAGLLSETRSWDAEDVASTTPTSTTTLAVTRSAKTVVATTSQNGLPNAEIATIINGLARSFVSSDGLSYTSTYDSLERLHLQKNPRHTNGANNIGKSVFSYKPGTALVESVTDASGVVVEQNEYDSLRRLVSVANADAKHTRYAYDAHDRVIRQWGAAVYPTEVTYNSYGERVGLRTWQTAPVEVASATAFHPDSFAYPASSGSLTTWIHDEASGLLWKKTDAAGKETEYDYDTAGRLYRRLWARKIDPSNSSSPRLTTTYGYFPGTADVETVSYNDTARPIPTPGLSYQYDRLGRVITATQNTSQGGIGDYQYVYDPTKPWRLNREVLPSFLGDRRISRLYDGATSANTGTVGSMTSGSLQGRSSGFELGVDSNFDRDLRHTWTYSNQPRLARVASAVNEGGTTNFTYDYAPSSALLAGYSVGSFAVSYSYEQNRDLLASIESRFGAPPGGIRTKFEYTHDAMGRRVTAKKSGTAYDAYVAGQSYGSVYDVYKYNSRSELESSSTYRGNNVSLTPPASELLPGLNFEYRYDAIGNRKSSGDTGTSDNAVNSTGLGADNYEVNSLNQYTKRENNKVTLSGTAKSTSPVAVEGGLSVERKDRAWAHSFTPDNGGGPAVGKARVYAAQLGTSPLLRLEEPMWFTPRRIQEMQYDDDGNLINDGVWIYTYNAENQLVRMDSGLAPSFGAALGYVRKMIDFKYDHLGRRVEKKVTEIATPTNQVVRRFVYDGWNLVAELNGAGAAIERSYTWGLGLGGSFSSSSTPGSLLQITDYDGGLPIANFYPTYDGQGNVASLVNASTGALAAVYEYDPYGGLIRHDVRDEAVRDNPFRHATKYHDSESGLIYYGLRYYDPRNGRFINRDPIEEEGGINLYAFGANKAVNGYDVLGMEYVLMIVGYNEESILVGHELYTYTEREYEWGTENYREVERMGLNEIWKVVSTPITEWVWVGPPAPPPGPGPEVPPIVDPVTEQPPVIEQPPVVNQPPVANPPPNQPPPDDETVTPPIVVQEPSTAPVSVASAGGIAARPPSSPNKALGYIPDGLDVAADAARAALDSGGRYAGAVVDAFKFWKWPQAIADFAGSHVASAIYEPEEYFNLASKTNIDYLERQFGTAEGYGSLAGAGLVGAVVPQIPQVQLPTVTVSPTARLIIINTVDAISDGTILGKLPDPRTANPPVSPPAIMQVMDSKPPAVGGPSGTGPRH